MRVILICASCDAWTIEAHHADPAAERVLADHARACVEGLVTRLASGVGA